MAHYDCLLIGHNELDFEDYYAILENMAISGGRDHVAFTDVQLNHVKYDDRPHQALEILTTLHNEGLPREEQRTFYNGDCLWTAITYLGSYLAKRGYTFDFVNLFHSGKAELKQKLKENTYELVVLTGTMYVFEQNIWEIVTFIRRHCREARIIAGGPYISKLAEEREPEYMKPLFQYLDADFYCYAREGEQTLVALIDALKNGTDVADVPNLAYRNGRSYAITREEREVNPLADNLIDYSLFTDTFAPSGWANVRISDGCPYACGFCAFPLHGNERYLHMTLDRIEREFDAIKATGSISHIFFIDATLNVPRRQFSEMLKMMIRNEYDFRWHCFFRCDQTDEETVHLMKEAGCMGVFLGLESANDTVLKNMDKSAHKEDFRRSMPWFREAGLRTMWSVLVGFPGETIDTFRETQAFVEELQPDFTRIQPWYCDPTTPVWGKREQFDLEGKGYGWKHYSMDSETAVELVVDSFMALRGVSWVPDPGYNWTATYQMETLGMPVERQQEFLALFAGTAKATLLTGKPAEHEPALLDALRTASQFDRDGEPEMAALEPFSGERYSAARSFWVEELRGVAPQDGGWKVLGGGPEARWSAGLDAGWEAVLAAYGRVLDGVEGPAGAILVAPDGEEPFPLRPGADGLEARLAQSREHARFAWFVLTHPLTAKEFGVGFPALPAAFVAGDGRALLDERRARYPELRGEPDVVLTLADGRVELSCATGRFDEAALAALGGDLVRACGAGSLLDDTAVQGPARLHDLERSVTAVSSTLPTVRPDEREARESPCVHQLFERRAEERPDAVALVVGEEALTYRELNERANALAHHLRRRGVGPDVLVGICMFRCVDMIVSLLAVLKAGGAYVPIDPGYPKQRVAAMLNDLELSLLLTTGELEANLPDSGNDVLCVDREREAIAAEPTVNPGESGRDDLCYAIFTSGSTGQAKAAAVYHKGWANLLTWFASEFEITAADRVLVISSFSFDITQRSIAMPLIVGGQLHLLDSRVYDPALIREVAARDGITLVNCAPSTFYPLIERAHDEWPLLKGIRIVFLGGEAISASRLREWARSPDCETELANVYGVAECSDVSSFHRLRDFERYEATSVPIGKPIFNTGVHILDEDLKPVPAGERGEICITGIGVGKGYVNDPLLTAEKFVRNPFEPGTLLYRTGDMGRSLPDGGFEMIGRVDHQVKIRGNRIDLGDVETNFRSHPDIREAVVVRKTFGPGDVRLVAYVVPSHHLDAEEDLAHSIHQVMKDRLPEYMLPSRTLILDELPLTPNGKIDRTALEERAASFPAPPPEALPRTALEEQVAAAFAEVLHLEQIGIADNFFNYGGDSYLVTVLLARIAEVTGARLSIFEFLAHPTVAMVAKAVERWFEEDDDEEEAS